MKSSQQEDHRTERRGKSQTLRKTTELREQLEEYKIRGTDSKARVKWTERPQSWINRKTAELREEQVTDFGEPTRE